jgi:hypothetical protein
MSSKIGSRLMVKAFIYDIKMKLKFKPSGYLLLPKIS